MHACQGLQMEGETRVAADEWYRVFWGLGGGWGHETAVKISGDDYRTSWLYSKLLNCIFSSGFNGEFYGMEIISEFLEKKPQGAFALVAPEAERRCTQWGTTSPRPEGPSSKSLQTVSAGEGVKTKKPHYTVGGTINWCNHCGKQYRDSSGN